MAEEDSDRSARIEHLVFDDDDIGGGLLGGGSAANNGGYGGFFDEGSCGESEESADQECQVSADQMALTAMQQAKQAKEIYRENSVETEDP